MMYETFSLTEIWGFSTDFWQENGFNLKKIENKTEEKTLNEALRLFINFKTSFKTLFV